MKNMFDRSVRDEVIVRISQLHNDSRPQWGKMSVGQMLRHVALFEDMIQGRKSYKRTLLGKVLGRWALQDTMKDKPMRKGATAIGIGVPEIITGDITVARDHWISLLDDYDRFSNEPFIHPFFGLMTKEQTGLFAYKHTDHHLRQFGC